MITTTRMCFAYGNVIRPGNVTAVVLGNATEVAIHPVTNLKYDDPWLRLKTGTPSAEPFIRFQLSAGIATGITCIGFINHDLMNQRNETTGVWTAAYTTIAVEVGSSSSGPWTAVDTAATLTGKKGNPNLLFRFPASGADHWRIRFTRASAHPAFSLGTIFLGKYYEVAKNPILIGGHFHTHTALFNARRAAGGARYRASGGPKRDERFEATFLRMTAAQYETLHWDIMGDEPEIVGIVQPENAAQIMPIGSGHFFGEMRSTNPQGTPDTAQPHLYNATIIAEGCV